MSSHVTKWHKFQTWFYAIAWPVVQYITVVVLAGVAGFLAVRDYHMARKQGVIEPPAVTIPVSAPTVTITSMYRFDAVNGVNYREYKNVGLTYYSIGDGYTPGITARSGRFVYDGAIAVSQPMWHKEVSPGDLIWVRATNRWYKVEDTMHQKYTERRVDIYTHDMAVANSGSSRTDILVMRQPRELK